jgi:predicted enzyme related to lactoylglutathione lyase
MSDAHTVGNAPLEVAIVVKDAAVMGDFYANAIGLRRVDDLESSGVTMQRYASGDGVVKLVSMPSPPESSNPPQGMLGGASGLRYFSVCVDDLDDALARVEAAGCTVPIPAMDFAPGVRIAIVEDPEGTWVELVAKED